MVGGPAPDGRAEDEVPRPAAGRPWFGPELDLETAVPQDYVAALGASPSSFTFQVDYPVSVDDEIFLRRQVRAVATLGSVVVLDLQPRAGFSTLDPADAEELGSVLDELHDELGTWFLARFAAEMNGSWEPWGQQPLAFRAWFRLLAQGLDATAPHVETVWSPVYGSGYPYLDADGARDLPAGRGPGLLDTDGDGRLTSADDPYGPYYPGDDVVDWVGLTLYRFGQDQGIEANVVPRGEYASRLRETWGYGDRAARGSFYDRFAAGGERPMMVQTSALYNPAVRGASELALKRSWWRQVLGSAADYPLIGLISWLEVDRVEPEVGTRAVDWRVTADPEVAAALRADLERSSIDFGPVGPVVEDPYVEAGPTQGPGGGPDAGPGALDDRPDGSAGPDRTSDVVPAPTPSPSALGLAAGAGVLLLLLVVALVAGRRRPGSSGQPGPPAPGARNTGLDAVRGGLVLLAAGANLAVVAGHTSIVRTVLGSVPVPEGLVLISGIALGTATTPLRPVRRALVLYAGAVLTALAVHVVSVVPGVDLGRLTTYVDPDTGERRQLFPDAERLFDYPTPWGPARRLLLLEVGPWATSMLGLFVVLALVTPFALWLLRRRWWLALTLSWALWGVEQVWTPEWSPAQAADAYPPLAWQLLLVHGLAIGHHRRAVATFLLSRRGGAILGVAALAWMGLSVWLLRAGRSPDPDLLAGVELAVGRLALLTLAAAVTTVVVARCWGPLTAGLGGVLAGVGRHALAVGVGHVVVLVGIAAARG